MYDNYFQSLNTISTDIAHTNYLDDIFDLIVLVAASVSHIKICSLWLIDEYEKPKNLILKAAQFLNAEDLKNQSLELNDSALGYVATHKKPLVIENVVNNTLFKEKETARTLGLVSMLGVPLIDDNNRVLGVLNCFTTQHHIFSETEIKLMSTIAKQAAITILNTELMVKSKLYEEELYTLRVLKQARETIMRKREMNVQQADAWIHKCSNNSFKSVRHISEAILLSEN